MTPAADLATMPVLDAPGIRLRHVVARTAVSLLTAVVAPAALVTTTLLVVNIETAVVVALVWMVGAMGWRWATRRPVSAVLVLALGMMTVKTAFTLATGNTFVYFVQPVFTDALVAAVFLGSLFTSRPIVARIAPDFYPVDRALAARPRIRRPRIRRLFQRLTLLWGLVIVVKGSLTLWLLLSQSTVDFVVIKNSAVLTLTLVTAAVTVGMSAIVGRQEGLLAVD
jgi:hypothetical protein